MFTIWLKSYKICSGRSAYNGIHSFSMIVWSTNELNNDQCFCTICGKQCNPLLYWVNIIDNYIVCVWGLYIHGRHKCIFVLILSINAQRVVWKKNVKRISGSEAHRRSRNLLVDRHCADKSTCLNLAWPCLAGITINRELFLQEKINEWKHWEMIPFNITEKVTGVWLYEYKKALIDYMFREKISVPLLHILK